MQILLTTVGPGDVTVDDLGGRVFAHPTVGYNLLQDYAADDVSASTDLAISSLQKLINDGDITLKDDAGQNITDVAADLEPVKRITKNVAQWNADRIKGKTVDDAAIADGYELYFNASSGKIEFRSPSAAPGGVGEIRITFHIQYVEGGGD